MDLEVTITQTMKLKTEWVWPNGDAPENPTADDVVALMRAEQDHPYGVVQDWGLLDRPTITVYDGTQTATY